MMTCSSLIVCRISSSNTCSTSAASTATKNRILRNGRTFWAIVRTRKARATMTSKNGESNKQSARRSVEANSAGDDYDNDTNNNNNNNHDRNSTTDGNKIDYQDYQPPKPPQRDTGIPSEGDINIDIDAENTKKQTGVDEKTKNTWFRESGVDRGEGGYRCRWTVKGGAAPDKSWEYRETHWEKADSSGYRELGAEKSGFNEKGETWWETWRELYNTADGEKDGEVEMVERSADKWARNQDMNSDSSREWQEKWWERFSSKNMCDRGVEKSGRENRHAWWEKWGEHYDPDGISLRWTDKWAENDKGVRWGDKWEERLKSTSGDGAKSGETWREQPNGEVWRRTWGEEVFANGEVRKYGESTTDEKWDVTTRTGDSAKKPYFDGGKPDTWEEALRKSEKLLNIQLDESAGGESSRW